MRVHFWRRHVRDTIIILEEGNLPHPRCENCDMFVPWRALNGRHKSTMMCKSGVERKRWRPAEAEIRESTDMAFKVYGKQIESVPRFTYLGRVMTAGGGDWPEVAGNLAKAQKSWGRLQMIFRREGATPRLCPKQQKLLHHRLEKGPRDPWCCSLPSKDHLQSPPPKM